MRVTNAMLSNNMLLGLNKNMNKLNTLYDQMNSLKKIQRPSDDPIILGRSLKLRLNVLETEQYKINIGEAKSWMEVSQTAIENTHGILGDIRKECNQAANGPLKIDDREKILASIEQLKNQLIQEANANYAGRNVFSGYKTNKKVLFDEETKPKEPVKFEQTFDKDDIEKVTYREKEYYRIRLPYGNIDSAKFSIDVETKKSTDIPTEEEKSFYYPEDGKAYFLQDTGELIISKEKYNELKDGNTTIKASYEKSNFKTGDPNPEVFFDIKLDGTPPVPVDPPVYTTSKSPQKIEYEIGIGTKLDVNTLGTNLIDPYSLRDIDELSHIIGIYDEVERGINGEEDVNDGKPTRVHGETINLSKLFTSGIGKIDKALQNVSREQADIGSRIMRLELTEKRLSDDEVSFTELLSRTEDVELERVFIDFNTQYAVYQSALQATSKVIQPTLMDFLR